MQKSQLPKAGWRRRSAAFFYDLLLLLAVLLLVSAIAVSINGGEALPGNRFFIWVILVTYGFFCWFWVHGGQTLGMRAWRLKTVTLDGQSLTWKSASQRFFCALLVCLAPGCCYLWMLFDKQKLAWHDRCSKTQVLLLPKSVKN